METVFVDDFVFPLAIFEDSLFDTLPAAVDLLGLVASGCGLPLLGVVLSLESGAAVDGDALATALEYSEKAKIVCTCTQYPL